LLQGNATVQTADKDAYVESNGMPMRYDLNGTVTSAIKLDRTTGWVIESRITQDMKGRADIKANDQLPEGLTIPMVIHSESVIRNL
jgi:molybdopterin-binding protein